ncbi:hypothetical protein VHEMI06800 [[Torrubiella] hemipterigena]|uniref:Uncharacterized protein n=1 Tax=[Torrubiella] hemipterigena TaxID=1531966 RepID=A0A0A1TLR9_9HYPO|nr:hypothetical protein VHEMI06800 [[Torrubiella] hemipterigena]
MSRPPFQLNTPVSQSHVQSGMFSFDYSAINEGDVRAKNVELGEGFTFLKREPVRPGQFFQRPDRTEKSIDVISLSEGNKNTGSPILETESRPLGELVTTSDSCASNMSKKRRSTGITERLTLTNEKKAAAMNKVAQNWNTCMQIAAEEQNIASKEIFKLKQSIRQQDIELSLANGNYQRSQSRVDDLENQLQDMQKKYATIENEKSQLEERSQTLEEQLQDSCDRVNKVEEKCGVYKDKLNEAIQEQQDLHKLSQHRCDELQTQLSQLLEERDVRRSEIDKAMSESQAKKEELGFIVAAVKDEISREREKGKIMELQFQANSERYASDLENERSKSELLRSQLETCINTSDAVDGVMDRANEVVRMVEHLCGNADQDSKNIKHLEAKIDTLIQKVSDISPTSMASRVADEVDTRMETRFDLFMKFMDSRKEFFCSELDCRDQKVAELGETLASISHELITTREVLQQNKMDSAASKDLLNEVVNNLDKRIQILLQEGKNEAQEKIILLDGHIQNISTALRDTITKIEDVAAIQRDSGSLHDELTSERSLTNRLKEKIEVLEREVRDGEDLKQKWKQDVQAIDDARCQLQNIQEKVTKTDEIAAKMDSMLRINSCIQATSDYLRTERTWVRKQLENRGVSATTTASSNEELGRKSLARKVVLASPINIMPRSDCVTVEQEQKQRREGAKPKPILRQQTNIASIESNKEQIEQKTVIENIRDSLVKGSSSQSGYFFPTVAEFMSSSLSESDESRDEPCSKETEESPLAKKQRLNDWDPAKDDKGHPTSVSRVLFRPSGR